MHSDGIIIDSNEKGFTKADVIAICSTGESTTTGAKGYIGDKGIGFKSVFKMAKVVHVQSGPFSFRFEYDRLSDDTGLEMVIPLDADFRDLPNGINTRFTLTLKDSGMTKERYQELFNT